MDVFQIDDEVAAALIVSQLNIGRIEMWTTRRLPFEPKGALLEARTRLRRELMEMSPRTDELLEATYRSTVLDFVDTENVLIYNVGTSAFANSSKFGLRFVREFAPPPQATFGNPSFCWQHYHIYSDTAQRGRRTLAHPPAVARFEFGLPHLSSSLKPHEYWWAAKKALLHTSIDRDMFQGTFSTQILISGPLTIGNVATLFKPMFDGVLAALHFDPTPSDIACQLLADKLQVDLMEVVSAIQSPHNALLGRRNVVSPYRNFVKWNPADDLCVVGELAIRHVPTPDYLIRVELSEDSSPRDASA